MSVASDFKSDPVFFLRAFFSGIISLGLVMIAQGGSNER